MGVWSLCRCVYWGGGGGGVASGVVVVLVSASECVEVDIISFWSNLVYFVGNKYVCVFVCMCASSIYTVHVLYTSQFSTASFQPSSASLLPLPASPLLLLPPRPRPRPFPRPRRGPHPPRPTTPQQRPLPHIRRHHPLHTPQIMLLPPHKIQPRPPRPPPRLLHDIHADDVRRVQLDPHLDADTRELVAEEEGGVDAAPAELQENPAEGVFVPEADLQDVAGAQAVAGAAEEPGFGGVRVEAEEVVGVEEPEGFLWGGGGGGRVHGDDSGGGEDDYKGGVLVVGLDWG